MKESVIVCALLVCGCGSSISNVDHENGDVLDHSETNADDASPSETSPPTDVGPGGGGGESVTAGSRLHPIYTVTSSADGAGSKRFAGWQDTTLGAPCAFDRASDGTLRCLPGTKQPTALFSDSACKHLIYPAPTPVGCAAAPLPVYVSFSRYDLSACSFAVSSFKIGTSIPTPSTAYQGSYGSCTSVTLTALGCGAGCTVYDGGTEVPPSTFVDGSVTTEVD